MQLIPPTKFIFTGDISKGKSFIKFGYSQLSILDKQMSYQNLNEGSRVVSPFKGVFINCNVKFKNKVVTIHIDSLPESKKYYGNVALEEEEEVATEEIISEPCQYFFRIKYRDPNTADYEVIGGADHIHLNQDRLIVWDLITESDEFTGTDTELLFDVDVITREIFYPINPSLEESIDILALADSYITVCPSQADPAPTDSLEDFALNWFDTGEVTDPAVSSTYCDFTLASTTYNIGDLYLCSDGVTNFCTMIPLYPLGIDAGMQDAWVASWCSSPLLNYYGQSWDGIDIAENNIGLLTSISYTGPPQIISQTYIKDDVYGDPVYLWKSKSAVNANLSYLNYGTWFTAIGNTKFNCFFCYVYTTKKDNVYSQSCAYDCSGTPCDAVWGLEIYTDTEFLGVRTPLEDIAAVDFLSYANSTSSSCSECPCDFSLYSQAFTVIGGGENNGWEQYIDYACRDDDGADPCARADRTIDVIGKRYRGAIHMVSVDDTNDTTLNIVHLSYWMENKIVSEVWTRGDQPLCDGYNYKKRGHESNFGYIAYVFVIDDFYWINPDSGQTEYWNIYDETISSGIIHPARCLFIEEYVNEVINNLQTFLDNDLLIEKMYANINCAYPLNWYGYGISDGLIKVPSIKED